MMGNGDAGYREELAKLTPGLRRFARALVEDHNIDAADDLVQATLVSALGEHQERRGIRLGLRLLANVVLLHRQAVRRAAADQQVSAGHGGGSNAAVRARHWESARRSAVRERILLEDVPLECREVLLLISLEKLTYVQTAECLGTTLNAVISLLARAREHLSRQTEDVSRSREVASTVRSRSVSYLRLVK